MRVMITGVASPIARLVAERLAGEGHEVIGVDRRGWEGAPAGVEMHAADIRKRAAEELFRKRRPDAVIHMATVTHLVAATEERVSQRQQALADALDTIGSGASSLLR